jgi:hypothetical protein
MDTKEKRKVLGRVKHYVRRSTKILTKPNQQEPEHQDPEDGPSFGELPAEVLLPACS